MTPEPLPSLDDPNRQQRTMSRRLARHFIGLCVIFGVSAILMTRLSFQFFDPLLNRLDEDWTDRERAAIRSIGGLESAVMASPLLELFDISTEQHVALWAELKRHPELVYLRLSNTVNAEIALVYSDGISAQDLPEPVMLEWNRTLFPPRIKNLADYEGIHKATERQRTFYERRMVLYRQSFGRTTPIAILTAGFDKEPASLAEADRVCEECVASQVQPGEKIVAGWPKGRVLLYDSLLVRYSYRIRDVVLYLAQVMKGTDNLRSIVVYDQNGVPFLSELQSDASFQFKKHLKGDPSLVSLTAHVRKIDSPGSKLHHNDAHNQQDYYQVVAPIFSQGSLRGMISFVLQGQASLLGSFRESIEEIRAMMLNSTIAATLLLILASVLMALRLRARIARPLEAIGQAARDFIRGDPASPEHLKTAYSLASSEHYTREARRLCEAYARMVNNIQQTLQEKDAAYTELQSTQKQLLITQRQSLLGVVAAGVAHEIKNALNPVKLRAERMLMAFQMKREVALEEGLNLIIQSVTRCAEISNKLSSFSRKADTGSYFEYDLNESLRDTLAMAGDVLSQAHIKVKTEFGPIPKLKGSPKEIQQAALNFLLNSKDAILDICAKTKRDGGNITIVTLPCPEGAEMRITDDGCGMTEETKQKVFTPFYTTKEPGKGTGLGMGVSQGILQSHGAEIKIESEWGKGTTLIVRFPLVPPTFAASSRLPSQAPQAATAPGTTPPSDPKPIS